MPSELILYTVYGRPRDYPDEFVVRRWDGMTCRPIELGEPFARGRTLDEVRRRLPPGLHNMGREKMDDPWIVEVWI